MTVRLLRPYAGQAVMTLYTGPNEDVLKATGNADDRIEDAVDYAPFQQKRAGARIRGPVQSASAFGAVSAPLGLRWVPPSVDFQMGTSGYSYAGEITGPVIVWGAVRYYVDLTNATGTASDSNAGTSQAAPLLTYASARTKTIAGAVPGTEIVLFGHKQDVIVKETASWTAVTINYRTVNRELPNRVSLLRVANATAPTWAATSGQPGVFETTIAAADFANVIDMANKVDMAARVPIPIGGTAADQARHRAVVNNAPPAWNVLNKMASIAAVAAAPGSSYHDGTKGYVQAIDSRNLVGDTKMLPLAGGTYARSAAGFSNVIQSWKGLDFIGGDTPFFATTATNTNGGCHFMFEGCSFQAGGAGGAGGLAAVGVPRITLLRCAAWFNYHDGFNYHSFGSDMNFGPFVAEIECAAGGNGTTGSIGPSENDSTGHEQTDIITQNCVFLGSRDRTVADIQNVRRWLQGGYIGAPVNSDGASLANYGVANTVISYVDGTQFGAPGPNAVTLRSEQVSVINVRNGPAGIATLGTIVGY